MTTAQRIMKWASEMHLARAKALALHAERQALQCERENQTPDPQPRACWVATHRDQDGTAVQFHGGQEWCSSCRARQIVNRTYRDAVRRLGSMKGALWRLAARAHSEVEAELDAPVKPDPRVRVVRLQLFRADCGHNFKSEAQAVSHMTRCWKSPETRTCKTCKHGHRTLVDDESARRMWECRNPDMLEEDFTPAHEKAPDICLRCPKWEGKNAAQ